MLTEMALRRRGREQGNNSTTLFHWEGRKLKVSSIYSPGRSIRPLVSDFPLEERLPRFQEHKINVWACLYWTYTKLHRGWKEQKKSVNTWRRYELYKYCRKNDGEKQKAQTNFSSQKFFALVIAYLTVHWPLPGDAFPTVLRLLIILLCSLSLHFFFFWESTHTSPGRGWRQRERLLSGLHALYVGLNLTTWGHDWSQNQESWCSANGATQALLHCSAFSCSVHGVLHLSRLSWFIQSTQSSFMSK